MQNVKAMRLENLPLNTCIPTVEFHANFGIVDDRRQKAFFLCMENFVLYKNDMSFGWIEAVKVKDTWYYNPYSEPWDELLKKFAIPATPLILPLFDMSQEEIKQYFDNADKNE
jgi:hypothetical protein